MDILSFVGSFVETINRESRRKRKNDKKGEEEKRTTRDDDEDRLVATVAGNVAFIPIRRYDTAKEVAARLFAYASVQQWYRSYTSLG